MPVVPSRFLKLEDVADELAITRAQAYALARRKELRAIKIGGRGIWRISHSDLEDYLTRGYEETARWIDQHAMTTEEPDEEP